MVSRSPIEQMVDKACGFDPDAPAVKLTQMTVEEIRQWPGSYLADYLRAIAIGCSDKQICLVLKEAARRVKKRV